MLRQVLALLALLGVVLAPLRAPDRLYFCTHDHRLHATCCCQVADASTQQRGQHGASAAVQPMGCCQVVLIPPLVATHPDQHPIAISAAAVAAVALPAPVVVGILPSTRPVVRLRWLQPPPRWQQPIYLRHCSLVM